MKIRKRSGGRGSAQGMTILEVLISAVVMMIGMVGVLGLFVVSAIRMKETDNAMIARQKAREAIESTINARNSAEYSWSLIQNTPDGVFLSDSTPLTQADDQGLYNTSASAAKPLQKILLPDGSYRVLDGYTRKITITQAQDGNGRDITGLRKIVVTVTYPTGGRAGSSYIQTGYISQWN